jgi:integrase
MIMTVLIIDDPQTQGGTSAATAPQLSDSLRARPTATRWPATMLDREAALTRMRSRHAEASDHMKIPRQGSRWVLDWLGERPGATWQERWSATGVEAAGRPWRQIPLAWLRSLGRESRWDDEQFLRSLHIVFGADLIRPSLAWLSVAAFGSGSLARTMAAMRDPAGFAELRARCSADPNISPAALTRNLYRTAALVSAKGGTISDITPGDVLEVLDAESAARGTTIGSTGLFYRLLHEMGSFGPDAPATLRHLRVAGQKTPEEMIDQYQLSSGHIRDLLVAYLKERQPTLDYSSLTSIAYHLAGLFWADLESHHPGIDSLDLPTGAAAAWKRRLRTITRTVTGPDGRKRDAEVERVSYRECLTPVRALYLDLAQWALEDPARWAHWVAPCPIGRDETDRRKSKRHRKSRMDARTRERLPVLPVLVESVNRRRKEAAALLESATQTAPGATFTAAGQTLMRVAPSRSAAAKIWAVEPDTGQRRDLGREEEHAFWAFAAVEALRATGIRVEELTELSHHSLVQYRLPTSGELVPLLQIAPSKTDTERLLVVSPELADVLSLIIRRVQNPKTGAIPLVEAYDHHERIWRPAAPLLFQRRVVGEHRAMSAGLIRKLLTEALEQSGLANPVTGEPMHFTPHDFRRLFITDAVLSGLPPHIAQIVAGHRDINVTMGYKAVYPTEAIDAHLAFLARRRSLRPSEEYRTPTDEEWTEFLGHFEKRKVATGTCGRAFGTPCIHEHACIRCPMLWPDPAQHGRLLEIRDNLLARIAEAEREGWIGEIEGLQVSLAGAEDKLAQAQRRRTGQPTVSLGLPSIKRI